jgi:hypothetical protein
VKISDESVRYFPVYPKDLPSVGLRFESDSESFQFAPRSPDSHVSTRQSDGHRSSRLSVRVE